MQFEVARWGSPEKGRQFCLDNTLGLAPLFVANEKTRHEEDGLLCAVEIRTSVSGLVDVEEMHRCNMWRQQEKGQQARHAQSGGCRPHLIAADRERHRTWVRRGCPYCVECRAKEGHHAAPEGSGMAIRVGYLLGGRRVLRRAPHHCGGTNVTPATQRPERDLQIGQGLDLRGTGPLTIRRRAIFIASPA